MQTVTDLALQASKLLAETQQVVHDLAVNTATNHGFKYTVPQLVHSLNVLKQCIAIADAAHQQFPHPEIADRILKIQVEVVKLEGLAALATLDTGIKQ